MFTSWQGEYDWDRGDHMDNNKPDGYGTVYTGKGTDNWKSIVIMSVPAILVAYVLFRIGIADVICAVVDSVFGR